MARMTMKQFISSNKTELFNRILRLHRDLVGIVKSVNEKECRVMIKNEPTLKAWAEDNGVTVRA